jgi:hypothetical protein
LLQQTVAGEVWRSYRRRSTNPRSSYAFNFLTLRDIEWVFTARHDGTTFVSITNSGFGGSPQEIASNAVRSTEGFSFVLAGAKALLEHNVLLNLVPDRFPDGLPRR